MLVRLWVVLSLLWAVLILYVMPTAQQASADERFFCVKVALAPFVIGPLVRRTMSWVIFG